MLFWHVPRIWKTRLGTFLERQITMTKLRMQFTKCVYTVRDVLRVLALRGKIFPSILRSALQNRWTRLSLTLRKSLSQRLSIFQYGMFSPLLRQVVQKMPTMLFSVVSSAQFNCALWLTLVKDTLKMWQKKLSAVTKVVYMVTMKVSTPKSLTRLLQGRSKT